jgi:hypothetical protein
MEHLVAGHMGGYWIDTRDPEEITEYCDQCGDYDHILLSWQEGKMLEALTDYFSEVKKTKEMIAKDRELGINKADLINIAIWDYDDDKFIIESLSENSYLSEEEKNKLIKVNLQGRKNQIGIICEVFPKKNKIKKKTL